MKLLLDDRHVILAIGSDIEYGVWGNVDEIASWRINKNYYMMDGNYHLEEVADDSIPDYVSANGGWLYKNGEFIQKADASKSETDARIAELENVICELSMQLYAE